MTAVHYALRWRRIMSALLLLTLFGVPLAAPQGHLSADDGQAKGLVVQPLTSPAANQDVATPAIDDGTIADLQALRVKVIRLDFWTAPFGSCIEDECRTPSGQHIFDVYDPIVNKVEAAGIRIIGLLGPGFVQGDFMENAVELGGSNGDNSAVHHFAAEAKQVAAHYPQIQQWEIWNEPNAERTYLYPSVYAQLTNLVTQYIKSANPDAVTIGGGLFTHGYGSHPSDGDDAVGYLRDVYRFAGTANWHRTPWDFLGVHIYVCSTPSWCPRPIDVRIATRAILNALYANDHHFRLSVTEFGAEAGGSDENSDFQVMAIEAISTVFAQWGSRVDAACVYKYQDTNGDKSFGLLGPDGHHRLAFDTYASLSF